jgi:hypothetical protein
MHLKSDILLSFFVRNPNYYLSYVINSYLSPRSSCGNVIINIKYQRKVRNRYKGPIKMLFMQFKMTNRSQESLTRDFTITQYNQFFTTGDCSDHETCLKTLGPHIIKPCIAEPVSGR